MQKSPWFKSNQPWRNGLVTATGFSLFAVVASLLWSAGYTEWAFLISFTALWLLISLIWSNDRFIEHSGSILANVVDHNFEHVHERIELLEKELERVQDRPLSQNRI